MPDRDRPLPHDFGYVEEWADEQDAAARARAARRRERRGQRQRQMRDRTAAPLRRAGARTPGWLRRLLAARADTAPAARLWGSRWGRGLIGAVAVLALATTIALVALWPHGPGHGGRSEIMGGPTLAATVTATRVVRCPGPVDQRCSQIVAKLAGGADRATPQTITLGPANVAPIVKTGDDVRVQRAAGTPDGSSASSERYAFASVDRRGTMLWLAIVFAVLVVVLARWRGLLALVGFAVSLWLVTSFVVPAVSAGRPAFAVAMVGAFAVMFVTVGLTYGLSAVSLAAILGIAGSLVLAGVLGSIAVHAARLDGRANEFSQALTQLNGTLSLQGVVLAGLVFGALGVLADQAVTQASAVMALRRASPQLDVRGVYKGALQVGRDHLVATTHTLVLVYVGATFPLLLVLHAGGVGGTDALNMQDLAEPVIATLVGAIALLVSVPLTTALVALIAAPAPAGALPEAHHGHSH
ncbi:MAG: YibE/F family protein [Conexibacter sp.]|nr:YibE/F family protein [Conexibacter sp.]